MSHKQSKMTSASVQQRHPRVSGEQIEEGPEGETGEQKSISHFRRLDIQSHIGIDWTCCKCMIVFRKLPLCVRDRRRMKYHPTKHERSCAYPHTLHTHTGKASVPRFSNLILVKMRWEMSCGGRAGDEKCFKWQDLETDCFIIHLQQYLSTHTYSHAICCHTVIF